MTSSKCKFSAKVPPNFGTYMYCIADCIVYAQANTCMYWTKLHYQEADMNISTLN